MNANAGNIENKRKSLPPEEGEVYRIEMFQFKRLADVKIGFNGKICLDYIEEIAEPDAIRYVCILFAGKWAPESFKKLKKIIVNSLRMPDNYGPLSDLEPQLDLVVHTLPYRLYR